MGRDACDPIVRTKSPCMKKLITETSSGPDGETMGAHLIINDDDSGILEVVSKNGNHPVFVFKKTDLSQLCREFLSTPRPRVEAFLSDSTPKSWDWSMGFWKSTEELQLVSSVLSFCEAFRFWDLDDVEKIKNISGGIPDRMPRPNWLYLPNMDCQNELIILAEDKHQSENIFLNGLLFKLYCKRKPKIINAFSCPTTSHY